MVFSQTQILLFFSSLKLSYNQYICTCHLINEKETVNLTNLTLQNNVIQKFYFFKQFRCCALSEVQSLRLNKQIDPFKCLNSKEVNIIPSSVCFDLSCPLPSPDSTL